MRDRLKKCKKINVKLIKLEKQSHIVHPHHLLKSLNKPNNVDIYGVREVNHKKFDRGVRKILNFMKAEKPHY